MTTRTSTKKITAEASDSTTIPQAIVKTTEEVSHPFINGKAYEATDLIPCRSVTQGELLLTGRRSGVLYRWYNVGDIIEVEFQDLNALKANRSQYLYGPYFIVEDENLLAQPRWRDLTSVYESLCELQDVDEIINLPPAQLKQALMKLPKAFLNTLAIEISTRIENGSYDSINRIKVFDDVLGTDLMCYVVK